MNLTIEEHYVTLDLLKDFTLLFTCFPKVTHLKLAVASLSPCNMDSALEEGLRKGFQKVLHLNLSAQKSRNVWRVLQQVMT
jgi:hypothetical protein